MPDALKRVLNVCSWVGVSILLVMAIGGMSSVQAKDTVKLGALMPMTGDLQAYGTSCITGVRLAAEQINAQGGVLDSELQIKVGDTQTKPQAGIDAAADDLK